MAFIPAVTTKEVLLVSVSLERSKNDDSTRNSEMSHCDMAFIPSIHNQSSARISVAGTIERNYEQKQSSARAVSLEQSPELRTANEGLPVQRRLRLGKLVLALMRRNRSTPLRKI
jgi:hypothetical protein